MYRESRGARAQSQLLRSNQGVLSPKPDVSLLSPSMQNCCMMNMRTCNAHTGSPLQRTSDCRKHGYGQPKQKPKKAVRTLCLLCSSAHAFRQYLQLLSTKRLLRRHKPRVWIFIRYPVSCLSLMMLKIKNRCEST